MGDKHFVLQGCRHIISALHAEMEGLLWAIMFRWAKCDYVAYLTDYQYDIKLMKSLNLTG